MNYDKAKAYCAIQGGRLCTKQELLDDCTAYSGCGTNGGDFDFIWSSTGV